VPSHEYDAVVVGSGPNGLAAAITIAREGRSVLVIEAADVVGGGMRTSEMTLPGFKHDVCSAIHPMGAVSPLFAGLPLHQHGLEWVHADVPVVNPLDGGDAAVLMPTIDGTVEANGEGDAWRRLFGPLVQAWPKLADQLLGPPVRAPKHPVPFTKLALRSLLPTTTISRRTLGDGRLGALFAGIAAHANTSLGKPLSAPGGLVMTAAGHIGGWPMARGGSQAIADAMVEHLELFGGKVETGRKVSSLDELPASKVVVFDTTPWQVLEIAGDRLPSWTVRSYRRFRHGGGSFKLDYALDGPMPWTNGHARRGGTVHVGGTTDEIAAAEHHVWRGRIPDDPFVLVAQQSLHDPTRAPAGKQTLWAYTHVPNGSTVDMTDRVERQIDRFAPGWRDLVLARHVTPPGSLQLYNDNYRGGDIAGGAPDGFQILFRPRVAVDPYKTGADGLYICSASTPPGGGVHGMGGWWAARSALRHELA
jgi:phytoene dehydrogenase-like protein